MWNLTVCNLGFAGGGARGGSIRLFGSGPRSPIEIPRVLGMRDHVRWYGWGWPRICRSTSLGIRQVFDSGLDASSIPASDFIGAHSSSSVLCRHVPECGPMPSNNEPAPGPSERPRGKLCRPDLTFLDWVWHPATQAGRPMLT